MSAEVELHLGGHCIETEAKRELKRLMDDYFDEKGDPGELEEKMELLRGFLAGSDFASLRSSDERLSGSLESYLTITQKSDGSFFIRFKE